MTVKFRLVSEADAEVLTKLEVREGMKYESKVLGEADG
jgi:hypothetical protein